MKNLLFGAFSVVLSLLIFFVGLEVVTRVALDDGMQYDLEMWKYAIGHKQESNVPGGGHVHVPSTEGRLMGVDVSINSLGLRGPEVDLEKQPDTFRILFLGDSITFGWGVAQSETMASRLEESLSTRFPERRIEVVNSGIGNANTAMQAVWFAENGAKFDPDLVILNYFINDAEPTPRRQGGWLKERSYAYVHFAGKIDTISRQFMGKIDWEGYYRDLYDASAPGWIAAKDAIAAIAGQAKASGVPMLMANIPEIRRLDPYPFPDVTEKVAAVADRNGVTFLDLLPSVVREAPDTLWVTVEDPHPNGKANKLFTDALVQKLIAENFIGP